MNNLLSHVLSVLLLIVPSISQGAAVKTHDFSQMLTGIIWINRTNKILSANIVSTNEAYESEKSSERPLWPLLAGHSRTDDTTIKGYGPYIVTIKIGFYGPIFRFQIPLITEPTDMLITENPEKSGNVELWYRVFKRSEALAIMGAVFPRIGEKAPAGGSEIGSPGRYEIYRQIAEQFLLQDWKQAVRIHE